MGPAMPSGRRAEARGSWSSLVSVLRSLLDCNGVRASRLEVEDHEEAITKWLNTR